MEQSHLHSSMERLKAIRRAAVDATYADLHSSMERLKVFQFQPLFALVFQFTFQYGEIKSFAGWSAAADD